MDLENLKKISDAVWEIPRSYRNDMRVPARVYATAKMLEDISRDKSLEQLVNVATLPGIQKVAILMPDAHEGYGFPIGGVAATEWPHGVISPGGIGYDINCGVRLLLTDKNFKEVEPYLDDLAKAIYRAVPSGVGRGGEFRLDKKEFDEVLKNGVKWALKRGYASEADLQRIESFGSLENADQAAVSDSAKKRGRDQLGTLGAGNHFLEIDRIDEVFDENGAQALGLSADQIVVLIHTGSRGLGHQVATDYIRQMLKEMPQYKINVPDRELACLPLSSPTGTAYFNAMSAAANFAWTNRQMITWEVRQAWQKVLGAAGGELKLLYDVAHNIAKIEEHKIGGQLKKLIVHRKGATRSFGPGAAELAPEFQKIGQPVIIPGSMGTASYVLLGTEKSMTETFGSTCHGAGRRMSRHAAKRMVRGQELREELQKAGIHIQAGSVSGLAEEAPEAYKDVEEVVEVVHQAGIAKKVVRLKPLAVIKG